MLQVHGAVSQRELMNDELTPLLSVANEQVFAWMIQQTLITCAKLVTVDYLKQSLLTVVTFYMH
jgi:hypothetical protein